MKIEPPLKAQSTALSLGKHYYLQLGTPGERLYLIGRLTRNYGPNLLLFYLENTRFGFDGLPLMLDQDALLWTKGGEARNVEDHGNINVPLGVVTTAEPSWYV